MSTLRQENGDDYPEAALKHLQDADALIRSRRFDGSAYLAGYVVECALKTLLLMESGQARHGHELTNLLNALDVLAVHAKTRTGRLYVSVAASFKTADILAWTPEMRYRGSQDAGEASRVAEAWLREARAAYGRIFGALVLDGAI